MLIIVTDKNEISRCQKKFAENLKRCLPLCEKRDVGYPGGGVKDMPIYTDGTNGGIWFGTKDLTKSRYWNAFGFQTEEKGPLHITAEINFAHEGINNGIGGLFAKDARTGKYFVLHRGKVGGGQKGVGKKAFKNFYDGQFVEVKQNHDFREVILVAGIDDPFDAVHRFAESVRDFKETIKAGKFVKPPTTDESLVGFRPEFAGIKSGKRNAEFEYETYHGVVVNQLRQHLSEIESGGKQFNTQFVDLGFRRGNKITSLYEVKTSCNRQSIYTGIGQLMVHSSGDKTIKKTLVLPEPENLSGEIYNTLRALGIDLVYYERKGPRVRFHPPR